MWSLTYTGRTSTTVLCILINRLPEELELGGKEESYRDGMGEKRRE